MNNHVLRQRTKDFELRIIRLFSKLPRAAVAQTIGHQMLRSGTSVAANYREASRARSNNELISKLGIVEQELDETALWLELLVDAKVILEAKLADLRDECDQLLRMVVSAIRNTKILRKS